MKIELPSLAGQTGTGGFGMEEVEALQKALTAGYGTDSASFTGQPALRIESLDTVMKTTIQTRKEFKLFNMLQKLKATATVDEWTERDGIGGFLGGTTNSETGSIREGTGSYKRRIGLVKYLMTKCQVSLVSTLGTNIAQAETVENEAGVLRVLTDCEWLCFNGDGDVVPTEFDGIDAQMGDAVADGSVDGGNVIDCEGLSLASIHKINDAAAQIASFGNFGTASHIMCSQLTQADFDNNLDPAFRVSLPTANAGGIAVGAPVSGIRTSHGELGMINNVFVRDEKLMTSFDVRYAALATANVGLQPASVVPGAPAANAASKFSGTHAGNYYYAVAGLNAAGESTALVSAQVAMPAGQQTSIVITASVGGQETGYAIYRSRKNGSNAIADMRLMTRVPKAGATTTYIDRNLNIPGTTKAYVLSMNPGDDAIAWRQLMPLLKFQLYPTDSAVLPWAQLLFGYLRLAKRKHHVVLKNIVPSGAVWKPFA